MPRKAQKCSRCGAEEIAGEGLCARCLEIHLTPAMMLDQCPQVQGRAADRRVLQLLALRMRRAEPLRALLQPLFPGAKGALRPLPSG